MPTRSRGIERGVFSAVRDDEGEPLVAELARPSDLVLSPIDGDLAPPNVEIAGASVAPSLAGAARETKRQPNPINRSRNAGDFVLRALSLASACLVLLVVAALIIMLVVRAWPSITHSWLGFFTQAETPTTPFSPEAAIVGTLYASLLALLVAAPAGVLIAIFLSEMCPRPIRRPVGFAVELLAAIPSIVYGFWALIVVVP